ncbi:MAG: hypothetical protein HFI34_07650 [Lachnospiraceae bacterium]|nr:hypothetical protein [Lachnospiraceae bacterium]
MRKKLALVGVTICIIVSMMACGTSGKGKESDDKTVDVGENVSKDIQDNTKENDNSENKGAEEGTSSDDEIREANRKKYNINENSVISPAYSWIIDFPKNALTSGRIGEFDTRLDNELVIGVGCFDDSYTSDEYNVSSQDITDNSEIIDKYIEVYTDNVKNHFRLNDESGKLVFNKTNMVTYDGKEFVKKEGEFILKDYEEDDEVIGNIIIYATKLDSGSIFSCIVCDGNRGYRRNNDITLSMEELEEAADSMLKTLREYDCDYYYIY